MQVGDLVKLANIVGGKYANLRGIIINITKDGFHKVLWTDGDITQEFGYDVEAVSCK